MISSPATTVERDIFSVARLNQEARALLEGSFGLLWVEGELSNLSRPASGHWYFTLKDANAQVRCAMFRGRNQRVREAPANGRQVLLRARISLYEARGDYQLIVEHMEEAGDGALRRAFDELKQRLDREGLFAQEHKQEIPAFPRRIGVITSPSGAAIRDILSVLERRFPALPVLIYPVPVQGEGAGEEIARTIKLADRRGDCEVLLLARGGGSLEDLWAFNEEGVARALHQCRTPVVCGVGHEIDFTIADFVADRRAPTPSVAAELVSPDQTELHARLHGLANRLSEQLQRVRTERAQRLQWLEKRLQAQHPGQRLRQRAQRLDELEQRLGLTLRNAINRRRVRLQELRTRLQRHDPGPRLTHARTRLHDLRRRLNSTIVHQLQQRRDQLALHMRALDTVSPLATLDRGYAIVSRCRDGAIVRDQSAVQGGERVRARFARGELICTVDTDQEKDGCAS